MSQSGSVAQRPAALEERVSPFSEVSRAAGHSAAECPVTAGPPNPVSKSPGGTARVSSLAAACLSAVTTSTASRSGAVEAGAAPSPLSAGASDGFSGKAGSIFEREARAGAEELWASVMGGRGVGL